MSFWISRKRREHSWLLLVPVLLLGSVAVIVAKVGGPLWLTLTIAVGGVAGTGLLAFAKEKAKALDGSEGVRRQSIRTSGSDPMRAPLAKEIDAADWGVHTSTVNVPYLERDAEAGVADAFEDQHPVLILGASMAGKTRMASKLVVELFPKRQVVMPDVPDGLASIMNAGEIPQDSVIWLDDLERYLTDPKNLKTKWIGDLKDAGNMVVATMRESLYEGFQPKDDQPRTQWETLSKFQIVRVESGIDERRRLAAQAAASRVSDGILQYGLGTYVGGGHLAVERLKSGRATNPIGAALVLAAVDWQRSGIGATISKATALALLPTYLEEPYDGISSEEIESGVTWATDRSLGGGAFRLLTPKGDDLRPFDYLVDHVAASGVRIPGTLWEAVAEADAVPGLLNYAGTVASSQGQDSAAAKLYERAAAKGDAQGTANWATTLERQDRISEAEELHRKAAEAGVRHGMTGLGVIMLRAGKLEEAEELLRRASAGGDGDGMANLGFILMQRGEEAEGMEWYQRAAHAGSGIGMTNYGMQLAKVGKHKEAEALYLAAAVKRNGAGMLELAKVRATQGKQKESERLIHMAVDAGNPMAMSYLAAMAEGKGDKVEAERLFKRASDRDDAVGLAETGKRLAERGDYEEAEKLLRRAATIGLTYGIHCLGVVFARTGRIEEAKAQYQLAIAAGFVQSMSNLGALLWEEGQKFEAEQLWRQAAYLGSAQATDWLSKALQDRGEDVEAEALLKEAALRAASSS